MIDCFDGNNILLQTLPSINIDKNKTDLYYKPTYTGHFFDINSKVL